MQITCLESLSANATHRVQIEVMPLFAGHLPFPKIKVFRYLPHTAAPAIQPDPGKSSTFPLIITHLAGMLTYSCIHLFLSGHG